MIDVTTPAKIASCNENNNPTNRVTVNVMASERVARETAWICLALINENPIYFVRRNLIGKK